MLIIGNATKLMTVRRATKTVDCNNRFLYSPNFHVCFISIIKTKIIIKTITNITDDKNNDIEN